MKGFFKRLGLRQQDEMERHIAVKAQRNGYVFLVIALSVWTMTESWQVLNNIKPRINLMPSALLVGACLVQTLSQLIMQRNAVKDDEDSYDVEPLFRLVFFSVVAAGVLATAVAAVVLMGVRSR